MERYKVFRYILLVIAVIFLGLYAYSHFKVKQINRNYPPIGEFISVEDINLHYTRKGSGRSVVLLHGRDGALQEYQF